MDNAFSLAKNAKIRKNPSLTQFGPLSQNKLVADVSGRRD